MSFSDHLGNIDPTAIQNEFLSWAGNGNEKHFDVNEQREIVDVDSFVAKYPGLAQVVHTIAEEMTAKISENCKGRVKPEDIDSIAGQSASAAVITLARYAEREDLPSLE